VPKASNMSRLVIVLLTFFVGCSAAAEPSDAVRAIVERLLARYGTGQGPGCASGVLLKGHVVFEGAVGTKDGRQPLTASTPMYLASVSKQFTAAAVYKLADSGKIQVNRPIRAILPELPKSTGAVTIHQLLNHTSGFRDYSALQEVAGRLGQIDNLGVLQLLAAQRALNFEPGTDYEYSNSDYVLLGLLVERVSGISLGDYVSQEIFKPLGMSRSWFQSDRGAAYDPAQGYALRDGVFRRAVTPPQTTGDGGMYASVSDLLRWMRNLERPREIDEKTIRQLESRARLRSGELLPHASGLFWNRYKGRMTISHNGSVAGFQADVVQFPKERLSVVCLCNRGDVDAASLSRQIAEAYLGNRATVAGAIGIQRVGPPLPADLAGEWESRQGFILSTKFEGDHLSTALAGEKHLMSFDPKQKAFSVESDGFRLLLRRRGRDTIELGWEGDRLNLFNRLVVTLPGPSGLGQYAGHFVNDELQVKWDLVLDDASLLITTAAGWRIPLAKAAPDRFEAGPWLLEFERKNGRISGFALHRERLWRLGFQRTGGTEN
jgi:CubicO group peptidase (beta-lactamase class C family)